MKILILLNFLLITNGFAAKYTKVMDGQALKFIKNNNLNQAIPVNTGNREYLNFVEWEKTNTADTEAYVDPMTVNAQLKQERADLKFGEQLFLEAKIYNRDGKGLSKAQRKQVKTQLSEIYEELRDGNICDAKAALEAHSPTGQVVQADLDIFIGKINSYKTCP